MSKVLLQCNKNYQNNVSFHVFSSECLPGVGKKMILGFVFLSLGILSTASASKVASKKNFSSVVVDVRVRQ